MATKEDVWDVVRLTAEPARNWKSYNRVIILMLISRTPSWLPITF